MRTRWDPGSCALSSGSLTPVPGLFPLLGAVCPGTSSSSPEPSSYTWHVSLSEVDRGAEGCRCRPATGHGVPLSARLSLSAGQLWPSYCSGSLSFPMCTLGMVMPLRAPDGTDQMCWSLERAPDGARPGVGTREHPFTVALVLVPWSPGGWPPRAAPLSHPHTSPCRSHPLWEGRVRNSNRTWESSQPRVGARRMCFGAAVFGRQAPGQRRGSFPRSPWGGLPPPALPPATSLTLRGGRTFSTLLPAPDSHGSAGARRIPAQLALPARVCGAELSACTRAQDTHPPALARQRHLGCPVSVRGCWGCCSSPVSACTRGAARSLAGCWAMLSDHRPDVSAFVSRCQAGTSPRN